MKEEVDGWREGERSVERPLEVSFETTAWHGQDPSKPSRISSDRTSHHALSFGSENVMIRVAELLFGGTRRLFSSRRILG